MREYATAPETSTRELADLRTALAASLLDWSAISPVPSALANSPLDSTARSDRRRFSRVAPINDPEWAWLDQCLSAQSVFRRACGQVESAQPLSTPIGQPPSLIPAVREGDGESFEAFCASFTTFEAPFAPVDAPAPLTIGELTSSKTLRRALSRLYVGELCAGKGTLARLRRRQHLGRRGKPRVRQRHRRAACAARRQASRGAGAGTRAAHTRPCPPRRSPTAKLAGGARHGCGDVVVLNGRRSRARGHGARSVRPPASGVVHSSCSGRGSGASHARTRAVRAVSSCTCTPPASARCVRTPSHRLDHACGAPGLCPSSAGRLDAGCPPLGGCRPSANGLARGFGSLCSPEAAVHDPAAPLRRSERAPCGFRSRCALAAAHILESAGARTWSPDAGRSRRSAQSSACDSRAPRRWPRRSGTTARRLRCARRTQRTSGRSWLTWPS